MRRGTAPGFVARAVVGLESAFGFALELPRAFATYRYDAIRPRTYSHAEDAPLVGCVERCTG